MDMTEEDGRRLRRETNRDAVIDALLSLFDEGFYQPTTNDVAERAGISPRSLFRYFEDVDDLTQAAIDRAVTGAAGLLDVGVGPEAPTLDKIEHLVEQRMRLFDVVAPVARAARALSYRNKVVAGQMENSRSFMRGQVNRLFAPELGDSDTVLPIIDALCSFEVYELLRNDQGLSRRKAMTALNAALAALLT